MATHSWLEYTDSIGTVYLRYRQSQVLLRICHNVNILKNRYDWAIGVYEMTSNASDQLVCIRYSPVRCSYDSFSVSFTIFFIILSI